MNKRIFLITAISMLTLLQSVTGQNSTYRSLLPENIMDEIIGEASGESALSHIIEMGAYNHNRPSEEYSGNFFETDYILGELEKYNIDGFELNRYEGGSTWDGISGELWEISPNKTKLADYKDLTAMLASGSKSTDIEAELVWVGTGSKHEIESSEVEGKIVVTSGSARSVHNLAVENGALGVVSFNSPRPLQVPLAIPISGISGWRSANDNLTFGFYLPPREGHILRDRLLRDEQIKVHAKVESQTIDYGLEVPECWIEGTDPDATELIFSAHIFEGYVKQGANDNISGSAALLEVARMLGDMIHDGQIERPKRTIRFIWVPEFSGTIPWVKEHKELMNKTLCNINLDMVGLKMAESKSFLCMHRTSYGNPHYLNDVMENYYEYVGITNRENLNLTRFGFSKRIVAPSGSDQPFYYTIDDPTGASDHVVFCDPSVKVPGIMMITWPDLYYHTSQDRADKCDPTQMKRVCVIAASAAYTIASADNDMALKIGNEVIGNASERMGAQLRRATDLIDISEKVNFKENYLRGYRYIEAALINEIATLNTVTELGIKDAQGFISTSEKALTEVGKSMLASFTYFSAQKAKSLDLEAPSYELSQEEKEAGKLSPKLSQKFYDLGYGASRSLRREIGDYADKYPVVDRIDTSEILRLCNGEYSAFEIKILLDGQMKTGSTSLSDVVNTIKILKELGYAD